LGVQLVDRGHGRAVLELELRDELTNSFGFAHGGVIMTLLDIGMAIAARTLDPEAEGAITIEMKASFIGAAKGRLRVEGRCLHLGKSVAFCEAQVRDAEGTLVSTASGTFMLRHAHRRKASAREGA